MNLPFILPTPIRHTHGSRHEPIIAEILKKYRLARYDLYTKNRHNEARRECFHRLQMELGWPLQWIADEFGMNHSTVLHQIRRHRGLPARNLGTAMARKHWITFGGDTRCMTDWARQIGVKPTTVFMRLNRGWSVERALSIGASK